MLSDKVIIKGRIDRDRKREIVSLCATFVAVVLYYLVNNFFFVFNVGYFIQ